MDLIAGNLNTECLETKTIGKKVSILRHLFGDTQSTFSRYILMTRESLGRLEKSKANSDIKIETLLKVYYFTTRLQESTTVAEYIKMMAAEINSDVIKVIETPQK